MSEPLDPGIVKLSLTLLALMGVSTTFFGFPGVVLVYGSVFLYAWYTGFAVLSTQTLIIAGVIAFLTLFVDEIAAIFGAKKLGASKLGTFGAFVGAFLSFLITGPIGLLIGPFIGALLFELIARPRELKKALQAGLGSFVGYLIGIFLKLIITVIIFVWALTVIW